jgi:phage terminase small subunit
MIGRKAPRGYPNLTGTGKPALAMSEQQRMAADYYIDQGYMDKRRALIRAGYSDNTACGNPQSVFRHPGVAEYIAVSIEKRRKKQEVNKERVLQELGTMAFTDFGDLIDVDIETGDVWIDWSTLTVDQRKAMESLEVVEKKISTMENADGEGGNTRYQARIKPKFYSKQTALNMICRILGLYQDKIDIAGEGLVMALQAGRERARLASKGEEE